MPTNQDQVIAHVSYRFDAPAEAVFDAWVTSSKVHQWFAPGMGEMTRVVVDGREGGMFSFVQRRGLDNVEHIGNYQEFKRPQRLAFTWQVKGTPDISRVVIDIVPKDSGCDLQLAHELHAHWASYKEKVEASWSKMLDAMATALKG